MDQFRLSLVVCGVVTLGTDIGKGSRSNRGCTGVADGNRCAGRNVVVNLFCIHVSETDASVGSLLAKLVEGAEVHRIMVILLLIRNGMEQDVTPDMVTIKTI